MRRIRSTISARPMTEAVPRKSFEMPHSLPLQAPSRQQIFSYFMTLFLLLTLCSPLRSKILKIHDVVHSTTSASHASKRKFAFLSTFSLGFPAIFTLDQSPPYLRAPAVASSMSRPRAGNSPPAASPASLSGPSPRPNANTRPAHFGGRQD